MRNDHHVETDKLSVYLIILKPIFRAFAKESTVHVKDILMSTNCEIRSEKER